MISDTLEHLGAQLIALIASTHPVTGTLLGVHDRDAELGEISESSAREYANGLRAVRRDVERVKPETLVSGDRIERRYLLHLIDSELLELEQTRWWARNPEQAIDTALTGLFFLTVRTFAPATERAHSVAGRLRALPEYLAQSRATLTDTPRVLTETAILSAERGVSFLADDLPAWAAGEAGGSAAAAAAAAVADAAAPAAEALTSHAAWLRDTHLGRSNAAVAVGEDVLASILSTRHLLADSPSHIAARGEQLLAEVHAEIDELATRLGHPDARTAIEEAKMDLPKPDELVEAYAQAMRWTERAVADHRLATPAPEAPLEVRPTPLFWRHTMPFAAYSSPAPFDQGQQGIFWVTPVDGDLAALKDHSRAAIPVVAFHEGYPGHHLQLTRANRHPSRARRLADSPLLIEGWAFYCEELAHEQGLLSPASRLCQLNDELWRACRVVIDMRLHAGEMSVAEAAAMLTGEAGIQPANAEAEVRRYSYTPGYPMSYAVGKQELLRLREEVRRLEGANFSLTGFHDRVLDQGSMPVPLVAEALLDSRGGGAPERAT